MPTRILVTGSRDWSQPALVEQALNDTHRKYPDMILVHGDCPTGADAQANAWALAHNVPIERHPADWNKYGRAAGPRRNKHMVDLGATLCIAFVGSRSRGAAGTVRLCNDANIEVWLFTE